MSQYADPGQEGKRPIRYFAQDESRFGLHTLIGRLITACGVKPIGQWQWLFKAFWLYGAVEPATGESFFLQFSHVDTECYQRFLDEFSQAYPDSLNIVQVDNGRFHKGQGLVVPENIILLFQPPYCPELNPVERLWEHLKADLKWASFKTGASSGWGSTGWIRENGRDHKKGQTWLGLPSNYKNYFHVNAQPIPPFSRTGVATLGRETSN
uniref:IS630 family transposase n=1 Tax=Trichocoleus desertorum TaxID=1481672 RepID=UPI0025B355A1|nr:IS630 family transposase [Trichocoleus desertorum]